MKAFGSCRICLVEIDGRAGTPASCTTPVAEGMAVVTKSDRLERLRRGVMELYLSDHPAPEAGDRDARDGRDDRRRARAAICRSPTISARPATPPIPISTSIRAKCIVCSRCVRACDEVQGTFALTISGRGFGSPRLGEPGGALPRLRMRLVRRLRPGLPDRIAAGESGQGGRPAREQHDHHLRLLRRRLHLQGGDEGRGGRPHGAVEGRQGQSRPQLRQGPLRLGLCDPPGAHPRADDPRLDRRALADRQLGRGDRPHRRPNSAASRRPMASARSAASPRRAAPTRRPSSSRSWSAPASATTMSIPARGSAIRRPATGSRPPSAPRPAPRISTASSRPT